MSHENVPEATVVEEGKTQPYCTVGPYWSGSASVEGAVWANQVQGNNGEFTVYSVTFNRSYKDKDGNWQKGGSWRPNDVAVLRYVLDQAYAVMLNAAKNKE